jgi:hypothetical protein
LGWQSRDAVFSPWRVAPRTHRKSATQRNRIGKARFRAPSSRSFLTAVDTAVSRWQFIPLIKIAETPGQSTVNIGDDSLRQPAHPISLLALFARR